MSEFMGEMTGGPMVALMTVGSGLPWPLHAAMLILSVFALLNNLQRPE